MCSPGWLCQTIPVSLCSHRAEGCEALKEENAAEFSFLPKFSETWESTSSIFISYQELDKSHGLSHLPRASGRRMGLRGNNSVFWSSVCRVTTRPKDSLCLAGLSLAVVFCR